MDITHDNVCSSMLSCFYSHLLSTGRPISSYDMFLHITGGRRFSEGTSADREIQRTLMEVRILQKEGIHLMRDLCL